MTASSTMLALWQDYRFLTKEMRKFLAKKDSELFYNLMNQRQQLQSLIDQTPDDGFKESPEGRALITEIQQDNDQILQDLKTKFNHIKRQHKVSQLYSDAASAPVNQKKWDC